MEWSCVRKIWRIKKLELQDQRIWMFLGIVKVKVIANNKISRKLSKPTYVSLPTTVTELQSKKGSIGSLIIGEKNI